MIELDIRDYCHKCPKFEPVVDRLYDGGRGPCVQNVSCEHKDRCDMIYRYIKFVYQRDMIDRHIKFESNKEEETDA